MIILGIIASLFPDIDLKISKPYQYFRIFVYIAVPLITLYYVNQNTNYLLQKYNYVISIIYIVSIILATVFSFVFVNIFHRFMVHRGLVHSIPFALTTSILIYEAVKIIDYGLHSFAIASLWLIGFITHLFLDELFSVDLLNSKFKKSFGTALSLVKCKNMTGTVLLYIFLIYYYYKNFY